MTITKNLARFSSLSITVKDVMHVDIVDKVAVTVPSLIKLQSTQPMNKEEYMTI